MHPSDETDASDIHVPGPFASLVSRWLQRHGASIATLARTLDVHRNTVRNWIQGSACPSEEALPGLLDQLEATPHERRQVWSARIGVEPHDVGTVVGVSE